MNGEARDAVGALSRDEVAAFVLASEEQIRAAARSRLFGSTRSVFDSEDVFASVLRRCDELAKVERIRPHSKAELLQFVRTMARNLAVDKNRQAAVLEALRAELARPDDVSCAGLARAEDGEAAAVVLAKLLRACTARDDRQIMLLRLRGVSHRALAGLCGTTEEAMRARWASLWRRAVGEVGAELERG